MSKPIKNLITDSYKKRFGDLEGAVLVDLRGVESNDNNALRGDLAKKEIKVTVIKNSLAKRAFEDTALAGLDELLEGPVAMVYGGDSVVVVARELIEAVKGVPNVDFKGAIMDGQLFGPDEVDALSKYPTREEAHAQAVQIILSPAQNLVSAVNSGGSNIASILKTIEEKLEKGEEIKKVG